MLIKKCEMCGKEIEVISRGKRFCEDCLTVRHTKANLDSYHRHKNGDCKNMCIDCGKNEVFRYGTRCSECSKKYLKEYKAAYKKDHAKTKPQKVKHQKKMNEVFKNADHNDDAKTFYSLSTKAYNYDNMRLKDAKAKANNEKKSLAARIKLLKKIHAAYHKRKAREEAFFHSVDTRFGTDGFW